MQETIAIIGSRFGAGTLVLTTQPVPVGTPKEIYGKVCKAVKCSPNLNKTVGGFVTCYA
jgi:hypothetical protein